MIKSSIRFAPGIAICAFDTLLIFFLYVIKNMFHVGTCVDNVGYLFLFILLHWFLISNTVYTDQVRLSFSY